MRAGAIGIGGALVLVGAALGARALAAQSAPAAAPAGPEAQVDVTACQACHGSNGVSRNTRVPNLAGQQPDYLAAQLRAFKSGTRKNDLMEAVAAQLSDAEITALAQYWSSRPATGTDAHGGATAGPAIPSRMAFPAEFPAGFTLYQSVTADDGAVAERYANRIALDAARAGRPLPDGSVLVTVNRPAPAAGQTAPGAPASYAAMEAHAGWGEAIPALLRNGNWDYALFDAARARNDRLNQAQCLACHRPRAADSFVFTIAELRERAGRSSD
ncbi:MAG TPA: cytochrome P460 family protein [Allosphingosinicella sp.]|nr:cytochrome P460 family protein [Allosphingosinicella sp.]